MHGARTAHYYCIFLRRTVPGWYEPQFSEGSKFYGSGIRGHQIQKVPGLEPDGGGVVIGMDAHKAGAGQKRLVQEKVDPLLSVIQNTQRRDGAGRQAEKLKKLLRGGKGQRTGAVGGAEGFQINGRVGLYGEKVVIPVLVVPEKEIFGIGFGVGHGNFGHLGHVIDGLMFRDLVPEVFFGKKGVDFLLVHRGPPKLILRQYSTNWKKEKGKPPGTGGFPGGMAYFARVSQYRHR